MQFQRSTAWIASLMGGLIVFFCALSVTGDVAWIFSLCVIFCILLAYGWILQRASRIQVLTELKSWKNQSKLILRAMGEGMFCVNLEGKVTLINAAALRMLGWKSEELLGQHIEDLIRPSAKPLTEKSKEETRKPRVNENFGVEVVDEQFMRRDGSCFPVAYTCSPIVDRDNTITGAVYIFHDDTERQRYESELHQSLNKIESINRELAEARERADKANQAKSLFLANMGHEIRTPLNGVIGITSLLERTELDEKQKKYIQRIRLSGHLLMGLINDILDYSRIEAKELTLERIPTDLHELLYDIDDMLRMAANEKKLELTISFDPKLPRMFLTDPLRLRQILVNLIGNAIKFTERGYVHITITSVAKKNNQDTVRFEIKDTGIGISKDSQSHLFQKFYQADDSITRRFGGTGLGLAICKRLVVLMGGIIGVDSTEGVGSTFWVEIPLESTTTEIALPVAHVVTITAQLP